MSFVRAAGMFACFAVSALAADRITMPVDPAQMIQLSGHLRPEAQPQFDRGSLDPARQLNRVTMYLLPAPGLDAFLTELQMPGSANYRRWLKPEEFADRFGLTAHDIAAITGWLESQGLRVEDVARGRHWITFSGSAGRVAGAFRTSLHGFRVNGEDHFANTIAPSIPQAFETVVAGIRGLDDFHLQSMAIPASPDYNSSTSHRLAPEDFATIYDLQPLYKAGIDGTGQTIVIVGASDYDASDIETFRQLYGLPVNDPQKIVYGVNPGKNATDLVETDLDLEWSGAIAPKANIIYVLSNDVFEAVQYAVDQSLGTILSISYGGCELYENAGFMRGALQQANAQGITVLAAAGDAGAAACDRGGPTPQATKGATETWPATAPEITAIGGTALNDSTGGPFWAASNDSVFGSALGYIPEVAWNDSAVRNGLVATGGGPSGIYTKPFWQSAPGVPADNARDIPDISLPASVTRYPYLIVTSGFSAAVGGTSAGAPSMAGILALLNQYLVNNKSLAQPGLGNINPTLYRMAQASPAAFHDVASGDNLVPCAQSSPACVNGLLGFSAGPAYDLTTGLGSVDGNKLATLWNSGTASTTAVTAGQGSATSGSAQLTATVQPASGSGAAPTGNVVFLANDAQLGSAALAASGSTATATLTVSASAIGAGPSTITAYYAGDATYSASSGSTSFSNAASGAGSLVVAVIAPNPISQAGAFWTFNVTLYEKRGVATTLTSWSIDGTSEPLSFFPTTAILANGSLAVEISMINVTPPHQDSLVFTGKDADGTTWTAQALVQFVGPQSAVLQPAVQLSTPAATVVQNPSADPSCQFAVPLTLQESGGFLMRLTSLTISAAFTGNIQQIFGTTRLAPYGMLQGTACLSSSMPAGAYQVKVATTSIDLGTTVNNTLSITLAAAPASTSATSASASSVPLVADGNGKAGSTVAIAFDSGSPAWTASVAPNDGVSNWLTVSPLSGRGAATLQIQANGAGLSSGVYRAVLSISGTTVSPQVTQIPITLVVGASNTVSITAIANNFSYGTAIAPGTLAAVFGANLAPATSTASSTPLPVATQGVAVTVNGITAPFYYASPGQLDVQIPYETPAGPAILAVNNNGKVAAFPFTVSETAPGVYPGAIDNNTGRVVTSAAPGQALLAFVTGEGDCTPFLATGATPAAGTAPKALPKPLLPVQLTVGGVPANVLFSGIPFGLVGVTQINFTIGASTPGGPQPVVVTIGGVSAQTFTLTVTQPGSIVE